MAKFTCTQHGCAIDADAHPDVCPTCNNPQVLEAGDAGNGELAWSDYSMTELRQYCASWNLEGWGGRTSKVDLIALLEAAEAAGE